MAMYYSILSGMEISDSLFTRGNWFFDHGNSYRSQVTHFAICRIVMPLPQFPLNISVIHGHFQMEFGIWLCHENTQVKYEFGCGQIIFGRVMPPGLRKIPLNFSFRSLSLLYIDIFNWNSNYRCVMRKDMSSLNLVLVDYFLAELCPLDLKTIQIIYGCLSLSLSIWTFQLKLRRKMCLNNTEVKFKYCCSQIIFNNGMALAVMYIVSWC